ncbi:MAG: protein kinase family protein [Microbacteriaceae bacterium]
MDKRSSPIERRLVGEGSYPGVFSYVDPDYGIKFAIKQAKRELSNRDQVRFEQEFAVMKRLSFPYVVEVYKFDDVENEYRMEFCAETLRGYIAKRNTTLSFSLQKRIALQFLYGLAYIQTKGLLHRDVSLQNVLLKIYESDIAIVKLSDFGLVKDSSWQFTRTQNEMRGTIRDQELDDFKQYTVINEMYSIGFVLSYTFTGRESLKSGVDEVGRIVQRCAAHESATRYATVLELTADVERLEAIPTGA